ncbi:EboA domain-containing protein [Herbidospora cretacea]|uniref:EboA domain-containing protein n=1 Tax=Herbidospora cretacea TaxID=28444 RepID=UPI000774DBD6|nr:EboA domain-containing protein [Herbidospora cretacea]
MTPDDLRAALDLTPEAEAWLSEGRAKVAADPAKLAVLFPAAGRKVGRGPLPSLPGWTADDAARALLLDALPQPRAEAVARAYTEGDNAEKRAVLRALPVLGLGDDGLPLVRDALRTNDTRLVAAAMGPYAAARLDDEGWRHGVLKCVFVGVPLAAVANLADRADAELARMLTDFAAEREAAGRVVPDDVHHALTLVDQES